MFNVFTLAQGVGSPDVSIVSWLQWGVLGLIILAIVVFKQLVPGWIYTELRAENEKLRTENKDLIERLLKIGETALPAIKESNQLVVETMQELRNMRSQKGHE